MESQHLCPQCFGPLTVEPQCPGYRDRENRRWVQCWPPCGDAALYECPKITCQWWFIDGMSRENKLFADNEKRRPKWLADSERSKLWNLQNGSS